MKRLIFMVSILLAFSTLSYSQSRKPKKRKPGHVPIVISKKACAGYVFKIIDETTMQPLTSCYIICGPDSTYGSFIDYKGFSSCIVLDKKKPCNCGVNDLYRKYQAKRFSISPNSQDTLVLALKRQ